MPLPRLQSKHEDIVFVSYLADLYLEPFSQSAESSVDNDEFVIQIVLRNSKNEVEEQCCESHTKELSCTFHNSDGQLVCAIEFDIKFMDHSHCNTSTIAIILLELNVSPEQSAPELLDILFYQALTKYFIKIMSNDTLLWLRLKFRGSLSTQLLTPNPALHTFCNPAYEALKSIHEIAISRGIRVIEPQ